MLRRTLIVLAIVALAGTLPAAGEDSPEVRADRIAKIRELLDLTGVDDIASQIIQGTVAPVRQAMPQVPVEWWEGFTDGIDAGGFLDRVVPIHDKVLTDPELDALLEFYRTPEGQSVLTKLPMIGQESMMAGRMWGRELADELIEKLEAAGHAVPEEFKS